LSKAARIAFAPGKNAAVTSVTAVHASAHQNVPP
jgi:hypothetical protein